MEAHQEIFEQLTDFIIKAYWGKKEKYPNAYIEEPINQLNATYDHYYRCKEYYYNRLN